MKRGRFAALASAALATPATRAFAQAPPAVRLGTVPVESYALPYYAAEQGLFARAGLDIVLSSFTSGGAVTSGVLGGALDVGCTNIGALSNAHARGLPVRVIAPCGLYTTTSPTTVLAVAKGSTLVYARDLNGKTIGVSTIKDLQQASVMRWVELNGGNSKSLKFLEVPIPQVPAALRAGRLDAEIVLEPTLSFAKNEIRILGKCYDGIAKTLMISAIFATTGWLEKNDALAHKLVGALRETATWANANHGRSGEILSRVAKLPPAEVTEMNRVIYADRLDVTQFQPVIDALAQYGFLPRAFPASELFWSAKG
jgi:NitT/TauT family transport system substrate-binding protein